MKNLLPLACCFMFLQFQATATLAAPSGQGESTVSQTSDESLTVLDGTVDRFVPKAMMQHYLRSQAQAAFEQWRTTYEAIKTPEQVAAYQQKLRRLFLEHIGGLPERTPLAAQVTGKIDRDGYRIEKVLYESQPRHFVSANLYLPDSPEYRPPYPGVLVVCGHAKEAKASESYAKAAALCALNGLAALVIDPIEQGERIQWLDDAGKARIGWGVYGHTVIGISAALLGQNTARFEIWDAMRGIDYLQSRPEIDGQQIGVTGNSGGGTQTAYLMALDPRVDAAAVSCYLTRFERLLDTIGPQDSEQCIHGQLAWGMDHADYILMRAPRPTLLAANTQDFFDIQGTWTTFRDAKRIYTRLGASDRVDLSEVDDKHGFQKLSREAAVQFFVKHLRGELRVVSEPQDLTVPGEKELWVTPNGQVMQLPGARSAYDLMAQDLKKLVAERPELTPELIRQTAGFPAIDAIPIPDVKEVGRIERDDCQIRKLVFHQNKATNAPNQPPLLLPALLFTPLAGPGEELRNNRNAGNAVLYVCAAGMAHDAAPHGPIEKLVREGRTVLALDVRGTGETRGTGRKFYNDDFGSDGKEYMVAYLLGKTYVGMRAEDMLVAATWLREQTSIPNQKIDLVACGNVGVPALHVAVAEPSLFDRIQIEDVLESWASLIHQRAHKQQLVNMVHGVLTAYDLPDLRAALGDRLTETKLR